MLSIFVSAIYSSNAQNIELVARFSTPSANGTVSFVQAGGDSVTISLKELRFPPDAKFRIHEFPVKYEGPISYICKNESIGGVYNPKNCETASERCVVGDLSGRLNFDSSDVVSDTNISLSGQDSIFGRSLAIYEKNGNVIACATINVQSTTKAVVGIFQAISPGIAGTIVLRQSAENPDSDTAVDIRLMLVDARSEPLKGLSLAVYELASTSESDGSCEGVKKIFNPLGKTSCDRRKHSTCMIGDLSGKMGQLDIPLPGKGTPRRFYIDTNLPLSGKNSVAGRSLVIGSNGKPLICAIIRDYQEMEAELKLENDGKIEFTQGSLYEPVMVNVSLSGTYDEIIMDDALGNQWTLSDGKDGHYPLCNCVLSRPLRYSTPY